MCCGVAQRAPSGGRRPHATRRPLLPEPVEHLTRAGYDENALALPALPIFEPNAGRIHIAEIDAPATLGGNSCRQGHPDARRLAARGRIISSQPFHVRRVRENSPRIALELLPLRQEIVTAMIAYFINDPTVSVADLGDVGRQDACGASDDNYKWTEVLMCEAAPMFQGISLHFNTVDWANKDSATQFAEREWFRVLKKTLVMNELIERHPTMMDRYDPKKRVGLIVDEWGAWYDVEPGTNPGFHYQQNRLRDTLVAGINLNIFNNQCERVRIANIAQTINVLQAIILTREESYLRATPKTGMKGIGNRAAALFAPAGSIIIAGQPGRTVPLSKFPSHAAQPEPARLPSVPTLLHGATRKNRQLNDDIS